MGRLVRAAKRWRRSPRSKRLRSTPALHAKMQLYRYRPKNTAIRNMVNSGRGFPSRMTMTHTYIDNYDFQYVAAAASPAQYVWKANGMYDPDFTGTGHQPMFFDQMSLIYEHYTVIGSKITIKLSPATTGTQPAQFVLFQNSLPSNSLTSMPAIAEQYGASVRQTVQAGVRPTIISHKWSAKKTFGGSVLGNTDLQGQTTTDPTEGSYWLLCMKPFDTTATCTFRMSVTISYIAVWNERKIVAQS